MSPAGGGRYAKEQTSSYSPTYPSTLTGALAWWDASDTATITESSGKVSQWNDKIGSGHMTQATGGAQPTTNAVTINSLNVLSSWGTGIWMKATISLTGLNTGSFMAVWKPSSSSPGNNGRLLSVHNNPAAADYNSGTAAAVLSRTGTSADWGMYANSGQRAHEAVTDNAVHSILVTRNGDGTVCYVDDDAGTSGSGYGTTNWNVNVAGIGVYDVGGSGLAPIETNALVGEIVICTAVLTSGERTGWFDYCQAKWGTP